MIENRRQVIKKITTLMTLPLTGSLFGNLYAKNQMIMEGKIKHSACRWCYQDIPLETLCREGEKIGLGSIDLVGPEDWQVLRKYGLTCAMGNGAEISLTQGWNKPDYHSRLSKNYEEIIPVAASQGITNIICFSGNREGIDEETGLKNCESGLKKILATAEKYRVNIVMELLNSKVDHPDYQCDHTAWGVELCERIASDRFKLLYDIYHMQIMEGDVIRTITENAKYIAHYHTGGVPGRHEIDETQELYYPAIMKAIADTGFDGYVAQEFIPSDPDKLASLKKCVSICNI